MEPGLGRPIISTDGFVLDRAKEVEVMELALSVSRIALEIRTELEENAQRLKQTIKDAKRLKREIGAIVKEARLRTDFAGMRMLPPPRIACIRLMRRWNDASG